MKGTEKEVKPESEEGGRGARRTLAEKSPTYLGTVRRKVKGKTER